MTTTFTPTRAADLRTGDRLGPHAERVSRTPAPCSIHPGRVFFEIEGYDERGAYNGVHSDVCAAPNDMFTVRTRA